VGENAEFFNGKAVGMYFNHCALRVKEEIKRRLNLGNACYHSLCNNLSSPLLFKSINITMYIIFILYGSLL
jgi:hypothetical protein